MKVLVVGGGGREHAIAWKLSLSKHITKIYSSPGNAGIAEIAECFDVSPNNFDALVDFVKYEWIDLTVVSSEKVLAKGLVNAFEREGRRILGLNRNLSQVGVSRVFTKNLMKIHRIPTAEFKIFTSYLHAQDYVRLKGVPLVIKTDGHTEDSGVFVASTIDDAADILKTIMKDRAFGDAGRQVIIEEHLIGERVSFVALTDGKTIIPITSVSVYRKSSHDSLTSNGEAAGAYSPVPVITKELAGYIMEKIMKPLLRAFHLEGIQYRGFISADLIIKGDNAYVSEFYCCFGDLEAQTILPRMKTDFAELILSATEEKLSGIEPEWDQRVSASIAVSSGASIPEDSKGIGITGLEKIKMMQDTFAFHENTSFRNSDIVTSGGRVLCVTSMGKNLGDASTRAYHAVEKIYFDGIYYKKDIG